MSQDTVEPTSTTTVGDDAASGPVRAPAADIEASLELVRSSALQLLSGFTRAPSVLRIRAGGVTVEAEWPTGTPVHMPVTAAPDGTTVEPAAMPGAGAAFAPVPAPPALTPIAADEVAVCAPAVGVLFHSPAPGAPPFVQVGDRVEAEQQVAIVEVMKLMIPVKAARGGTVTAVLKADGDPVEYDEPLFLIRPAGS
ncbi:acetyl-CoA carboxylase biotin carboxyl carrier protein [Krasilnikovia sp. MM14-A1259]|uniref:acetyl-CoA carboxylase biotin carboxyl carrier protein n=1 Tax=Krasilnikovia sp. MM14-A1259 TaxID=3373539 RepID=UPI00382AF6B5